MPTLRRRPRMPARKRSPRAVVVGDLVLDLVLAPERPLVSGTDVPGRVSVRQGGSAANTARWLARLGVRTTLVCAVARDGAGRALVEAVRSDGVRVRVSRLAGQRTGRIGVLVASRGERSFVADRGAADGLRPEFLRPAWFAGADLLHLPAYSLLGEPLGRAGRTAVRLARVAGLQVSLDLASVGPLLAAGRAAALELVELIQPDLLFATAGELHGLIGPGGTTSERALGLAPIVIVKRGPEGVTIHARDKAARRFDVATRPIAVGDPTGAGDAFDAGFIAAWLVTPAVTSGAPRSASVDLRRAALAGHRAAARALSTARHELALG